MVFRNDFAVRLLAADAAAGFEAPIRIYVYENADGTATVSYIAPSVVFAPYQNAEVQAVAKELDAIFKNNRRAWCGRTVMNRDPRGQQRVIHGPRSPSGP